MPRAYSVDLRERVIAALGDGCTITEVAQRFAIAPRTAARWHVRKRTENAVAPRLGRAGRHRALSPAQHHALRERIRAVPDATIAELQTWLAAEQGISVGWSTVWRAVDRLDLTRKKRA